MSESLLCCTLYSYIRHTCICEDLTCEPGMLARAECSRGDLRHTLREGLTCRGIVFGVVYGGIIFPPERAIFFPTAIVSVVVFGPVFAQSIFIGPSGFFYFSQTIFYTRGGVRIFNPGQPLQLMLCMCALELH